MAHEVVALDHVQLAMPPGEEDAAIEFYGGVLGLPELKRWGQMPGVEFQAGNLTLAVMEPTAFGQEFRPHGAPVALHVDDFEGARTELESRGVEFLNEIDSGVCNMAFFTDPDGNALMLHHRYAPQGQEPGGG